MPSGPRRFTRRIALGAALSVLAMASLTACGESGGSGGQGQARVLNIGNGAEPLSLDPHKASGTWENNIIGAMFMGLTTEDPEGKPIPGMAESWTTSPDGLVWTFKLRAATWSDGVPVTADDFVFGFRRILDPKTVAQYATLLYPIKGAEAVNTGKAAPDTLGVRAVDPRTVEITLNDPAPYLPGLLAHYTAFPVPKHVVEKVGDDWIRPGNVVSNGSFTLAEWRSNDFVRVVKNEKFFDAANVCLNEVIYYPTTDNVAAERQVRSGKLDISDDYAGQRLEFLNKELPGYARTHVYNGLTYLVFNTKKPPLDDARVRQALNLAIDREFITREILRAGQTPAFSLVPPGISNYKGGPLPGAAAMTMEARRAEAKKLLEAAGYGPNKPLKVTFSYRNAGDTPRVAPVMQEGWKQIAPWVTVELAGTEVQIHYDNLRAGAFEVGDAGWIADYDDAKNFVFLYETRSGAMNYGKYSNPQFDALVAASDKEADGAKRAALLRQAEELALKDAPFAPVFFLTNKALVNPRVTGWVDNAVDIHRPRYLCTKEAAAEGTKG